MRGSRLTAVGDDIEMPPEPSLQQTAPAGQTVAIQMMAMALKALSQRALVAVSNLFMLLTAASVFVLWFMAPAEPSTGQLVRLGLYAIFVLVLNLIKRGR